MTLHLKMKEYFLGEIFKSTSPCPSCSSCNSALDMQDVIFTGQLFSRDLIWRDQMSGTHLFEYPNWHQWDFTFD